MDAPGSTRNVALDGWRGIAILMVLFDHLQMQWLGSYRRPLPQTGQHGVTLFFVLSGYLITHNLLNSEGLASFYIRRIFRLMPVAWTYLLFLVILGLRFPAKGMGPFELSSCLLFFRNYVHNETQLSAVHFWSLSIEEQFYLIWPWILVHVGKKRAAWIAGCSALGMATFRLIEWSRYDNKWMSFHTEVRADALCVGCLLALLISYPSTRRSLTVSLSYLFWPSIVTFLVCVFAIRWLPPLVESCAIAVLLSVAILKPDAISARVVSFRPLAWLGIISYSVYVWQEFFTNGFGIRANAVLDCLIPVVALGSYYLVERPCTQFGRRLTAGRTASSLLPSESASHYAG